MNEIEALKKKYGIQDNTIGKSNKTRNDKDDKETEKEIEELKALNYNLNKKCNILGHKLNELKPGSYNITPLDFKHNYLIESVLTMNYLSILVVKYV